MSRYGNKISESPESIRKHVPTTRNIHSQIPSPKQQKSSVVQICASGDSSVFFKRDRVNYPLDGQASPALSHQQTLMTRAIKTESPTQSLGCLR